MSDRYLSPGSTTRDVEGIPQCEVCTGEGSVTVCCNTYKAHGVCNDCRQPSEMHKCGDCAGDGLPAEHSIRSKRRQERQ